MIEEHVEQASTELLERYGKAIEANPGKLLNVVNTGDPLALWFTYVLIGESRTLKWLTVVLIVLTAVLALLTLRLAFL